MYRMVLCSFYNSKTRDCLYATGMCLVNTTMLHLSKLLQVEMEVFKPPPIIRVFPSGIRSSLFCILIAAFVSMSSIVVQLLPFDFCSLILP